MTPRRGIRTGSRLPLRSVAIAGPRFEDVPLTLQAITALPTVTADGFANVIVANDLAEDLRRGAASLDPVCRILEYSSTRTDLAPLGALPPAPARLLAFLASTGGNFDDTGAVEFRKTGRNVMGPEDFFLLGTDFVKDQGVLSAAHSDASSVTAAFNSNIPRVIHRAGVQQNEAHLAPSRDEDGHIDDLDRTVRFGACKSPRTETSRPDTEADVRELFGRAGTDVCEWPPTADNNFARSLAHRTLGDS